MKKLLIFAAAALLSLSTSVLKADTAGVSFTNPGTAFNNGIGYSLGYAFTTSNAVTIDGLGYFDNGGLSETHQVGIYDSTGTLLASATVTNAGTQIGFFNFTTIPTLTLSAGQSYQVVGTSGFIDPYAFNTIGFTTDPNITFNNSVYSGGNTLAYGQYSDSNNGYFGANVESLHRLPSPNPVRSRSSEPA